MANSDWNWQRLGETDPYFAVLTSEKFRSDNIDLAMGEFRESGRAYVDMVLSRIERHFGPIRKARALDFGCGVGRLTIPLADHFASVVGIDIAPAMLREAAKHSGDLPITYYLSERNGWAEPKSFDFVISQIVLQHIPIKRGMRILDQLLLSIALGGACSIHISTRRNMSAAAQALYWFKHRIPGAQALHNLRRGRKADAPIMQMNEYPLAKIVRLFHDRGFSNLLLDFQDHGGIDTVVIEALRSRL